MEFSVFALISRIKIAVLKKVATKITRKMARVRADSVWRPICLIRTILISRMTMLTITMLMAIVSDRIVPLTCCLAYS
jgi:hypothetical protein